MVKLLGHTLGTPQLPLAEALELFRDSGLDGAEIIWLDDYVSAISQSRDPDELSNVKALVRDLGLSVGCLTPYTSGLNSLDAKTRSAALDEVRACLDDASELDAPRIRLYAGSFASDADRAAEPKMWELLVDALQTLGDYAFERGVTLCVENHFSTMTVSAAQSARLMRDVDHPAVGILYDQANLTFTHDEAYAEAIPLQAAWIKHVHVKDLEFIDPDRRLTTSTVSHIQEEDRVHRSRMIGDGILDWAAIIGRLASEGYQGDFSLEYEYRWNPEDLPEPHIGFPESARRLRKIVDSAYADVRSADGA